MSAFGAEVLIVGGEPVGSLAAFGRARVGIDVVLGELTADAGLNPAV